MRALAACDDAGSHPCRHARRRAAAAAPQLQGGSPNSVAQAGLAARRPGTCGACGRLLRGRGGGHLRREAPRPAAHHAALVRVQVLRVRRARSLGRALDRDAVMYDVGDGCRLKGSAAAPLGAARASWGREAHACGSAGRAGARALRRARPGRRERRARRPPADGLEPSRPAGLRGPGCRPTIPNGAHLVHGADEYALWEGGLAVEVGDGAVALARARGAHVRPRAERVHAALRPPDLAAATHARGMQRSQGRCRQAKGCTRVRAAWCRRPG